MNTLENKLNYDKSKPLSADYIDHIIANIKNDRNHLNTTIDGCMLFRHYRAIRKQYPGWSVESIMSLQLLEQ